MITTHPVTRHPGAAWLYLGSGLSSALGNAISNVVWPWLVLHRTGDPAAAGLVATCILLPSIIVAVMGGDVIDRYGRKGISVISDIISAASVVWLIAVDTTVGATLPWFIAIGIFGAVGDVPGMAARTALVGDISERSGKSLDWLAGANQSIMGVCYLVGPAIAGVLLGQLPITWILWLTAACSGIAALMTWVIRLNAHTIPAEHSSVRGTVTVWRDVVKHPMLRPILIVEIVIAMTVFPYLMVFLPAHFTHTDSPTTMGFALSSYAVGMIAGSIVIAAVGERLRRNLLWLVAIGATNHRIFGDFLPDRNHHCGGGHVRRRLRQWATPADRHRRGDRKRAGNHSGPGVFPIQCPGFLRRAHRTHGHHGGIAGHRHLPCCRGMLPVRGRHVPVVGNHGVSHLGGVAKQPTVVAPPLSTPLYPTYGAALCLNAPHQPCCL